MESKSLRKFWSVKVCASLLLLATFAVIALAQEQKKDAPKISDDEQKALTKINAAADIPTKLKASNDYLKKYSKSTMRPKAASHVAGEIEKVTDEAQRAALSKQFISTYNQPDEAWYVITFIVGHLLKQNKIDEAFQEGTKYLEKNPDDARVYGDLAIAAIQQAQQQNAKYVQPANEYSAKAIELMEGDKKNEKMNDEYWKGFRNQYLPKMYQVLGLNAFYAKDNATAKTRLESAAGLDQSDPLTFAVLGQIYDDEYQTAAKEYNAAPMKFKDDMLKRATEKLDLVIENFARSVAASDGKPQYQQMQQQLMPVLETYYSFRNNGKKDGLPELIQKYKKPASQ